MQVLINAIDGQVHLVEVTPETTIAQLKVRLVLLLDAILEHFI